MNPVQQKTILLGVTGSIAAYKAVELASRLTQAGGMVEAILTPAAEKFVTPLTFQSITGRKAYTDADLWGREGHVTHIGLGRSGDLLVIAPASANTLAKLARGIGDNLLTVTALAAHCPLLIAPAMDAGMFSHSATQENVEVLRQRGATIIGPAAGHLASGLTGVGRMVEAAEIYGCIRYLLARGGLLAGKKIVVTAGGTQEAIDPVRVITNRSSGKQGYAIAQAALDYGADVTLISAARHLSAPYGCHLICVQSADDMLNAVLKETAQADVLIMAAAVADFRPANPASQKIKKDAGTPTIALEPTPDILTYVAARREKGAKPRFVIGFAAETEDLTANARAKLEKKRLDLIVANDIAARDAGFEVETNRVTLIFANGEMQTFPTMQKTEVADLLLQQICKWMPQR